MADTSPAEDFGSYVRAKWDEADLALAQERRDYWLNVAFIEGEQWVMWHEKSRTVAEFPRPRNGDRVRLTANKIQPNLVTLLAKLMKRTLGFEVPATDADDASLGGARLGEHLLESARVEQHWEQVRHDELYATFCGATSAVVVEWDPNAGAELGEYEGQKVHEGQERLSALAITEFTLEPGSRTWQDARWFIMAKAMPPAQVKDHWQLDFMPDADATSGTAGPLQKRLWFDRGYPSNVELTNVFTYYERPSGKGKGRWAVVVNGKAVVDKPWPFPFKTLNLYPFRQLRVPKRWTGHTLLTDARPLQVAYNHGLSMLAEHMKLAGNARLALPDTSGIDAEDLSDLPGEVLTYDGMSSSGPHWIEPPNIPRWLIEHVNQLGQRLDDVMGVHDISRGVAPGDRNSGLALSVLAEKDETPMGLMAHDQSQGWAYIGSLVLKLYEAKVLEDRQATVQTPIGMPLSRKWTGKMLAGQTTASVPLDNVMPTSRAAMQAWLLNIADRFPQLIQGLAGQPGVLAKMLDMPGASMFGEVADADVAEATQENELMFAGIIPSAGNKPAPFDYQIHDKHIAEHNRARKSKQYKHAEQRVRDIFDLHVLAHETLFHNQAAEQSKLNAVLPGSASFPQAAEPPGSMVPQDHAEQQAVLQAASHVGGAPAGGLK